MPDHSPSSAVSRAAPIPLWLLDVDGVVNAVTRDIPDGYEQIRADGFAITYRPAVMARIAALHTSGSVEVRWLTTWCDDAATTLAPSLGLPDCAVEGTEDHRAGNPMGWWKADTAKRLSDADPERPLIWTDDDLDHAERNGEVDWLRDRTGPTLAIAPDWRNGISDEHLDRIEAFVARLNPSADVVRVECR